MPRVDVQFHDRARIVELISLQATQNVLQRQAESLDHEVARIIKANKLAATLDKLLQILHTGVAYAAGQLGRITVRAQTVEDRTLAVSRENDHVMVESVISSVIV